MLNLKFDLDITNDELSKAIEANLRAAAGRATSRIRDDLRNLAKTQKLRSGFKHWDRGLGVDKVAEGVYLITLSGKLASMMEDGFTGASLKQMILNGNRAKANKSVGKNYVDVPISADGDNITRFLRKNEVKLSDFKDATSIMKQITISDWKKGGTRSEKRVIQRVKDVIKSRKASEAKGVQAGFLTIKRITPDSSVKGWAGAKVFNTPNLDHLIEQAFEVSLKEVL